MTHDNNVDGGAVVEEWRKAVGFEGFYEVSSFGRIRRAMDAEYQRSTKAGRILTPDCATGYERVSMHKDGKCHRVQIHRAVAAAFLDGFIPGRIVNHKDGNPRNNHRDNLEWVTARENTAHAWRTGLAKPLTRSEHGATIIDDRGARAICFLHYNHGIQQTIIAEAYGVSISAISDICRNTKIQ